LKLVYNLKVPLNFIAFYDEDSELSICGDGKCQIVEKPEMILNYKYQIIYLEAIEMELKDIEHEIVIVDDDSSDGTIEVVRELSNKYPIKLISRKAERGLGSAIITGLKIALSNEKVIKIVTMDADLSHDPRYLKEMLRKSEGLDILIGSRYVKHGRTEKLVSHKKTNKLLCQPNRQAVVRY